MKSRVYCRVQNGRVVLGSRDKHDFQIWALWKPLTYRNWSRVMSRSSVKTENLIWKYMLVKTNLFGSPEKVSRALVRRIMKFRPSCIPHALAQDLIQKSRIPGEDVSRIEDQVRTILDCQSPNGVVIPDIHPVVEEALLALSMKERFKLPYASSIQDMDYKTVIGFRLVAEQISDHIDRERIKDDVTKQAQAKRGF